MKLHPLTSRVLNELAQKYSNSKPIAVLGVSNVAGIAIMDILDDYIIIKGFTGDMHCYKLHPNNKGGYFTYAGHRYSLDEFIKV